MDLAEWLRDLGLEQYAPAFREHDIDQEVLYRLTAEDLRELGVASIGHRRRLLNAIAALAEKPANGDAAKPEPQIPTPALAAEAEPRTGPAGLRPAPVISEGEPTSRSEAL